MDIRHPQFKRKMVSQVTSNKHLRIISVDADGNALVEPVIDRTRLLELGRSLRAEVGEDWQWDDTAAWERVLGIDNVALWAAHKSATSRLVEHVRHGHVREGAPVVGAAARAIDEVPIRLTLVVLEQATRRGPPAQLAWSTAV